MANGQCPAAGRTSATRPPLWRSVKCGRRVDIEVKAEKVVAVMDANRIEPMEFYHAFKIIFLCKLIGGEPKISHETMAVDFFDPSNIPPLSIYRTNENMLQEVFAHVKDPSRPTAFD